jgi:hypothetical protein
VDAPGPHRYSLDLTAFADDEVEGALAAESGFRREFESRLELLAAIEAALAEQPHCVRPDAPTAPGGQP